MAKRDQIYIKAWKSHIDDLIKLALHADVEWEEYKKLQDQLYKWVDNAVKKSKETDL